MSEKAVLKSEHEYEMLKDKVHNQYDEIQRYKNIIDEAIEYIEKGNKHFKENYNEPYEYAFMVNADEIMKILKGKSDE